MESNTNYTKVVDQSNDRRVITECEEDCDYECRNSNTKSVQSEKVEIEEDFSSAESLIYRINDRPPFLILISASMQHIILALPSALTCSSVAADVACIPWDHHIRAKLFCGTLFMCGLSTIMQTAFGVRLPIFQGSSSSFLVPLLALSNDNSCPQMTSHSSGTNATNANGTFETDTMESVNEDLIHHRLQMMSGALMLASLLEVIVGGLGLFRFLISFIGPITIAVTISMIGFTICKLPVIYGRPQYAITFGCMFLVMVFVLHLKTVRIPLPKFGNKGKPRKYFAIFKVLPIMAAVTLMWALSWILTVSGVYTNDKTDPEFMARADAKTEMIDRSPWLQLSYPGMFGFPQRDIALTTSFMVAILSSMLESVGDYYAAHKVCEVAVPSTEAISRGIFMEGLASLISGSMALGHATTSYSGNISVLTLTQTASRAVMYTAGVILIAMSLIGKLGAAMTTVPNPILGGISVIVVGSLLSIGLSNLKRVDMTTTRNMLVVGVSLASGVFMPQILEKYPEVFKTGSEEVNQLVHVLIGTPMFVASVVACLLDNTTPGSRKSRGFVEPLEEGKEGLPKFLEPEQNPYTWPCYAAIAKRLPFLRFIPFLPK